MPRTILVLMKLQDNVELLLKRLENAVKPGNRIVFMFEYQQDVPAWLLAHITAVQTGFHNGLTWQEHRAWLSWDEQRAQAEKNAGEPARRAFRGIGVEVLVDLYSRSVSDIVKRYLETGDIALILVSSSSWLERLKIGPISVRNWFVRQLPQFHVSFDRLV